MLKLMLVAGAGGFFGTCLRYLSGKLFHWLAPASAFPWSTLTVNVVGSQIGRASCRERVCLYV